MKVNMSTADADEVIVGAVPLGHLTLVKVAVVMPDGACVSMSMNDFPAVGVGIVNVHGVLAVNVAVSTVPVVNDKVLVEPTVPTDCSVST
jgi:hypothetical protein